jgi:putative RecB family exonuclease
MPTVYSHSRLSCFEDCPKRFQYRYVMKLPSESESIEAFVGKRVHEVLERLYRFVSRGLVPSVEKVLFRFRALWDESFDPERIRIVRQGEPLSQYLETGERCVRNFYYKHYPFDADETLGLEERITFQDPEHGFRVQGFIDRLVRTKDGSIEIHDFKTSRRIPSQKRLDADRQLALYQLAIRKRHPDTPIRLVWHYLAHGATTRVSERTPQQLDALRQSVADVIERIEREDTWEAKPSPLCGWCEFLDVCPAGAAREGRTARPLPASKTPPPPPPQLDLL